MPRFQNYAAQTALKNFFVFKYRPKIFRKQILSRNSSSILYLIEGRYLYELENESVYLEAGEAVYLPQGAHYTYNVVSEQTLGIQVEFELEEDGQPVVFSNAPVIFKEKAAEIYALLEEMERMSTQDKWLTISNLYRIIGLFCEGMCAESGGGVHEGIVPAVQYIESHLQSKIYVEDLAALCGISQSHLRRLFIKHLGMSPIQYKNRVLMQTACKLLRGTGMNVSETADALGFNDVYTFSQLFKKEIGISPKKYMNLM